LLMNSLPIPRQQLIEPVSGVCGNASEHIGERRLRGRRRSSLLILDVSWLNQLDDDDMPPFRFPPSPTLGDSSQELVPTPATKPSGSLPSGWSATGI
jgi:hypothetical protein